MGLCTGPAQGHGLRTAHTDEALCERWIENPYFQFFCGEAFSPDLSSAVTAIDLEKIAAWQSRPLEPVYLLVFFDALRVKVRDEGIVRNKAVYIALGVRAGSA